MLKIDYKQYPGRKISKIEFELDETQKPIISIITPYFNSQKYIEETANCILNQTFPYWEWIIVDDGSEQKDALLKLKEIEKMDNRIKVLHKNNAGAAEARDYGIEQSDKNTEYIMFLDSDDVLDKTYFECAYWTLQTHPEASWTYTDTINFEGQKFLWRKWYNPDWELDENLLTVTAMVRKKDLQEVGCFGLHEKKVYEDWYLWLKLIKNKKDKGD